MITIEAKGLGRRRPLFEGFSIPPPPGDPGDGDPLTLRRLITHVVHMEVEAFHTRQEARRLDRVLSKQAIERGIERGKVSPEGRDSQVSPPQPVDVDSAVATALEAFIDGMYLVVIDGQEYRDLDAIVHLEPESRITFLRLTFLAGG